MGVDVLHPENVVASSRVECNLARSVISGDGVQFAWIFVRKSPKDSHEMVREKRNNEELAPNSKADIGIFSMKNVKDRTSSREAMNLTLKDNKIQHMMKSLINDEFRMKYDDPILL